MVDLPRSYLDSSVTQGSQSSVSGGEIRSAFGELAAGMDELGQTFEAAAIEKAGLEGQGAVYTDENGKLKYDSHNPLSRAGKAFNRSAQQAFVSQISMDARPAVANLEVEAKGNVGEFDKLSQAYVKEMLKGKDPLLRGAIQSELTGLVTNSRTGMIRAQQNRDLQSQDNSITARIKMANEDASALARSGGTHTVAYYKQLDTIRTLEREKVGNPLFAYSQTESEVFLRGVESGHMAEAIVGQVETIYHSKGLKAAQEFAQKSFDDPSLGLSPGERSKYRNGALDVLKQFSADIKVERADAREAARALREELDHGGSVSDEDVYATQKRLSDAGDPVAAIELGKRHVRAQQKDWAGLASDKDQQAALASGSIGNGVDVFTSKIVNAESGGDPNARNPNSTASGVGQFLDSTWLTMMRKYRPDIAGSDAEILALKSDRALGTEMTTRFAEQNAASLTSAGFEATAGNIYLAHFLGAGGAKTVLGADARTPIAELVEPQVIDANPFLASMNVAELRSWANRKMNGPNLDPEVRSSLNAEVGRDVDKLFENMKKGLLRGQPLAPDDLNQLGASLAALGDRDRADRMIGFLIQTGDYSAQSLTVMQQKIQEVEKGGVIADEQEYYDFMITARANIMEGIATDPLETGRRIGLEGVADIEPINFADSAALGTGLAKNIAAARKVAEKYSSDTVGVLTKNDASAFKSLVATGNDDQIAAAMVILSDVPDDLFRGTIGMSDVKEAFIGASQSRDYSKYNAAMMVMDKLYNRAPQEFARIFGDKVGGVSVLDTLQDWQGRLRYQTADEFKAEFDRRQDPQYAARHRELIKAGEEQAKKITMESVVEDMGIGAVPTDGQIQAAFEHDYRTMFAQRYAATHDAAVAASQTAERLKQHWGTSVVSGGQLMLHPPEQYYPSDQLSYDYLKEQLTSDLIAQGYSYEVEGPSGRYGIKRTVKHAWPHVLVADAQTESEAAIGRPTSYQVVVTNPHTGMTDLVKNENEELLRLNFDYTHVIGARRAAFAEERRRILARKKPFGRYGNLAGAAFYQPEPAAFFRNRFTGR